MNNKLATTENGALSLSTTGNARVNLFFKLTRDFYKNPNFYTMINDSFNEDKLDTLKLLFNSRDCRGGKGDRQTFIQGLLYIENIEPNLFKINANIIPTFGRYKDLIEFYNFVSIENKQIIIKFIATQLKQDVLDMNNGLPISLLAKWVPSENKKYNIISKQIACELFGYLEKAPLKRLRKEYLSPLRSYLNIVERLMCKNDWDKIDFSKVPSVAMHKLKKAFIKHVPIEFNYWLSNVKNGIAKINIKQLYPHDLVRHYMHHSNYDEVIEEQWKQLVLEISKTCNFSDSIVLSDVSSSMMGTSPLGAIGQSPTPMEVSIGLGLLISELTSEPYKNNIITFSTNPLWHKVNQNTLYGKVTQLKNSVWGGSTNFYKVFDLILQKAIENNCPANKMPKRIFILSDMQFNESGNDNELDIKTQFEYIKSKYENTIYTRPQIIFWNLRSDTTDDFPINFEQDGTALITGFNTDILKHIMTSKELTPYSIMRKTIDDERYSIIKIDN
jgi:hypothetical protein